MAYCTSADIETLIGVANLAAWSQLDPDASDKDDARIEAAIAWASEHIDDRMRGSIYAIPIVGSGGSAPSTIIDVCRRLAAHWLYTSRGIVDNDETGDRMQEHADHAESMLNRILSGQIRLAAATASSLGHGPAVVL